MVLNANKGRTTPNRQLWLVPAAGQSGHQLVADVAVKTPTLQLQSYAVPDGLAGRVSPGASVEVPYGRGGRAVPGLCVRLTQQPWDQTRPPIHAADPGPAWLSAALVELGLWVSGYYACSPWKTFAAILPSGVRQPRTRQVRYVRATGVAGTEKLTLRQAALLAALAAGELRVAEALQVAGVSTATLRSLCARGLLECTSRAEAVPRPAAPPVDLAPVACPEDTFALTAGQRDAGEQIRAALADADPFRVFVLFGVPGSGKTEVYVRAIRDVIGAGRQALLLIPEIALATQVVERLMRRFQRVAVLHSQLTARARQSTLTAIAAGEVDVVIGTRSAVFAPCPRLGLIVVDEEQEGSFKNLAAPYYHARDVAIKRGQVEGVPVLLGSATPSLETWNNAQQRSHYRLLRLPERVPGARLPEVRVAATDTEEPDTSLLRSELRAELAATLAAGQQAILLHNRRGYAMYLRCVKCGLMVRCVRCAGHLVYHQSERVLKCHRCGVRSDIPARCLDDTCGGRLERTGSAIQRLEEELRRDFPVARLLRLDSDTMRRRDDYRVALQRFEAGDADILLGTQMVAKGLDFPGVRLVGVIEADAALSLPDFRAAERVFQLIVQVVGRAGRREGASLAVVQTGDQPASVIGHALRLDYEAFAAEELGYRRRLFYPPAARLVRLVCADRRPHRAREEAERVAAALRERAARIHAQLRIDPVEACLVKQRRELLRYQILIRGPRGPSVQTLLHDALGEKLLFPRVERFTIDVDPLDLL